MCWLLQVQSVALGDGDNPYETLWRAMFWLGLGLVIVTLAVWILVVFLVYMRWEVPAILQTPRPQFMLLLFGVPAIAQACACKALSPSPASPPHPP